MNDTAETWYRYDGTLMTETEALCASPKACAVADEWSTLWSGRTEIRELDPDLARTLDALELATRESPLRKVRL